MKQIIDISSITSVKLKRGDYEQLLPEYYALKSITENNPWHSNQNVFDHVVAVFEGLEEVSRLNFLDDKKRNKLSNYLNTKVGSLSRKELLTVATLLHDVAKADLLIKSPSGNTSCPGHELIGSSMVIRFSDVFGLDEKGINQVTKIVHYHGDVNDFLTLIIHKDNQKKYLRLLRTVVEDIDIELLLFMYADMMGSDLKMLNSAEYKKREFVIISSLKFLLN